MNEEMPIIKRIHADWIAARKARERIESVLLGTLIGAIQSREKTFSPSRKLTEAEIVAEVKKMLDGVRETRHIIQGIAGREEELKKILVEDSVLVRYVPAQIDERSIETFAREHKNDGLTMGQIMSALKQAYPGQYDGKVASNIVKKVLSEVV